MAMKLPCVGTLVLIIAATAHASVRAGGSAVVTQADVVQGNRLPPGKYLLQIRLSASKQNWEQQTLFIQVVD